MTSDALFAKMNKEAQLTKSGVDTSIQWRLTDGTLLDDLKSGSNSGRYQQIHADTDGLVTAWQNYYLQKRSISVPTLVVCLTWKQQLIWL